MMASSLSRVFINSPIWWSMRLRSAVSRSRVAGVALPVATQGSSFRIVLLDSPGRAYITNPDLVERFGTGAPLREADRENWYQGGDTGYLDYPSYQH